jgi:hypothetical protein
MGAKITLSNGREVEITAAGRMTHREYRTFTLPGGKDGDDDAIIIKYTGLTLEELLDMPQADVRSLAFEIIRQANAPIPNSVSASTSQ